VTSATLSGIGDAVLGAMGEAVIAIDDRQRIVLFNRSAEEMFGYAAREVLGRSLDMLLPAAACETHRRHVAGFLAAPEHDRFVAGRPEIQGRRKDGTIFPALAAISKTAIAGHTYMAAVVHDLTLQRTLQTALDRAQLRYQAIFQEAPVGIAFVGLDGKWREVNPAAGALLGYDPAELVGRPFDTLTHPEDVEAGRRLWQRILAGEIPFYTREKRYLRKDGTVLWANITVAPVRNPDLGVEYLLVLIEDISQRRRQEEAVRRLARIVEDSANEAYVFDAETLRFVFANRSACENLGYSMDELRAFTPLDIKPEFTPESFAALVRPLRDRSRNVVTFTTAHRRKNGSLYDVRVKLQLAHGETPPLFFAILEDITEQKRLGEQLRQSQKMQAVGQLTGGVAHDFNNLLQVILGNLEFVAQGLDKESAPYRAARLIKLAADRAGRLTQHLLAFARQQPLESKPLNLAEVAGSLRPLLERTLGEIVAVRIESPDAAVVVDTDSAQLQNAVLNLAINARDAMPEGGTLTIAVDSVVLDEVAAADRELQHATYGRLRIRDTGCGMTPEVRAKAFEPFFTTKEVGKGTGLGLSMVFGYAKQSGGHVELDSEPGRGTTVTLLLPLAEEPAVPTAADSADDAVQHCTGGATVLVVEDDALVRAYAAAVIRSLGYSVIEAEDGPSALTRLADAPHVDLLFTDVILPGGLNGKELAEKAREARPGLKILFTSGYPHNVIVHQGRLDPDVRLVAKPYRKAVLARALDESLAGRAQKTKTESGES
jgi:PAS domain S-box-containing protein